ncbi:MAG: NAD-dependent epimerase/dehydratase family protein [Anaerolineales bacterium]
MTTLLITGVSSYWGQRVASALAEQKGEDVRLVGLADKPPFADIPGLEFIRGNLNTPLILDLLLAEKIETVLYLDPLSPSRGAGATTFLTLCAEAGVRRIILKSSTAVYGASPNNPLYLSETHALDSKPHATLHSLVELESYANGLTAQYPDLTVTVLRFAHILGPTAETPLAQFLLDDRAPTLLGFNPLFQLIHEDDVVAALVHAALNDLPGIYNFAAEDVLPLHKILALAGKLPLPIAHPLAAQLPARLLPLPLEHLRYPCLANLTRMQTEFGFTPARTAEETITEFATEVRRSRYMPDALDAITNPLRNLAQRFTRSGDNDENNE